jgi:hypothetical protein
VAEQRVSLTFKQPAAEDAPARKQFEDRTNLNNQFFSAKLQTALARSAISTAHPQPKMPHSVAAPIKSPNTDQAPHQQPVPEPEDTLMSERAASPDPTSSLAAKDAQEEEQRQLIEGPPANTPPLDILLKKHFLRSHPGPLDESILLDYLSFMWAVDPHTFCVSNSPIQSVLWS